LTNFDCKSLPSGQFTETSTLYSSRGDPVTVSESGLWASTGYVPSSVPVNTNTVILRQGSSHDSLREFRAIVMESIQQWQLQALVTEACQEIATVWITKQHNDLGIELSDTYLALAENKLKLNVNNVPL